MDMTMKKTIYTLALAALLLPSCGDFLEPKSENEFVPRTVESLDEVLLYETYRGSKSFSTIPFFSLISDDVAVAPFKSSEKDLLSSVHLSSIKAIYTWQSDMYYTLDADHVSSNTYDMYSGGYARILGCNAVLDYLHSVEGKQEKKDRLEAEARALRAYWYFYLVNIYGIPYGTDPDGLGVPLHLTATVSGATIERNSVREVYEQVLADLKASEELFERLPRESQWNKDTRVSLPFVQLLLSRVYLYMEDWENALLYADKVIDDGRFRLLNRGEFPSGSYINMHSYSCPEVIWPYGYIAEFTEYENPYMMVYSMGGRVAFVIASSELFYLYANDDIRRSQYLVQDERSENKRAYSKIALKNNSVDPESNNTFARSFRISEAYLNKAEAQAELYRSSGDDKYKNGAIETVGILRRNRIENPDNDVAQTQIDSRSADRLVNSIRNERRRELCFEDHRWFDLRRYGMPRITHIWYDGDDKSKYSAYAMDVEDCQYTLPIPPDVMLLNSALVQNPLAPKRNSL